MYGPTVEIIKRADFVILSIALSSKLSATSKSKSLTSPSTFSNSDLRFSNFLMSLPAIAHLNNLLFFKPYCSIMYSTTNFPVKPVAPNTIISYSLSFILDYWLATNPTKFIMSIKLNSPSPFISATKLQQTPDELL